jgi:type IX secretion system PorP/SprF family membrane protein
MMKKICILFLFFSHLLSLEAQQIGLFSHEFYKPMISDPAFTGSSEVTNAMLISRSQWTDFKNAPQMNVFTLDGIVPNKKMGIGIDLFSDKKGISNKIGGNIYYAYRLMLNDNAKFTFGISLGITDHTLHYSEAVLEDASDPAILGTTQRETTINGNAGIGFFWKKLEAGISVPQLLGNSIEYQDNVYGKAYYANVRHYLGLLKYGITLSADKEISLTPMVMVHFLPNVPLQYDANLNLEWKNKFWIGATYKSDYAISGNAGICISKKMYVGYSYDFIIGKIGKYPGMSHELMLNFVFGKEKHQDEKAAETTVAATVPTNSAKLDSLASELEAKENKIQSNEEQLKKMNQEIVQLQNENQTLKKNPEAKSNEPVVTNQPVVTKEPVVTNEPAKKSPEAAGQKKNQEQNTNASSGTEDKIMVDGVPIMTAKITEFNYLSGKSARSGFYVMAGTFFYRDFATAELKRVRTNGHPSADIIYSPARQHNYVVAFFGPEKEEALKQLKKLKEEGVQDAWMLSLEE